MFPIAKEGMMDRLHLFLLSYCSCMNPLCLSYDSAEVLIKYLVIVWYAFRNNLRTLMGLSTLKKAVDARFC